ncbi:MAG: GGDEF domain-containing protein [Planctomycetes bacterium]|nr:GGDEF domain-containing protein [Planctomycetota bacterium]
MSVNEFYRALLDNLNDGVYFTDSNRKITYFNRAAEKITGYMGSEVIGSHCSDNILVHVNNKGENLCSGCCPLAESINQGTIKEDRIFLHHKDGHRVPVLVRIVPLKDTLGKITGAAEIFSDISPKAELMQQIDELQKQALVDPLTATGNRRYADIDLRIKLDQMIRYGWKFGVIFADVDSLKKINDQSGHEAGDRALKMVAQTLLNGVRASDLVCRWGGDEFIALITNVTPELLYVMSDRLRAMVEQSFIATKSNIIRTTVSIGATLAQADDTPETLIKRADRLLYLSKQAGRNHTSTDLLEKESPAGR